MVSLNNTQPSFSAGIISTELFSRIDYSKLQSGLQQCENWEVRPAGGAIYRAGTQYISEVKDSSKTVTLIPFVLSRDNGYCLEFGDKYIRFYKGATQIESGGSPYELVTTYTMEEVASIKYAQYKNQLFLVHKNHAPAVLTMNGETNWTLTNLVLNPAVSTVTSVTIAADNPKEAGSVVLYDKWQYAVSMVDTKGNESLAVKSNTISSDIDLLNQPINVSFTAPSSAAAGCKFNIYRIYKGEFYLIYTLDFVSGTTNYSLKDISFQPDTTKSIKQPFDSFDNNNYPSAVGIWRQRLIFGGTGTGPNTLYGSNVGTFDDFTTTICNNAEEAFELELNAGDEDVISDIIPLDDLIVMTQTKIWRVTGTSAANMNAYIESYSGVSGLRPFAYKKSILYIDSSLNTVSNFIYSYELNGYTGQNLDILCRHMFDGYTLKDISFMDTPYGVLYVVRSDGVLLGLTYLKEENIYAWHKHTTKGTFENICVIDTSRDDNAYVVVKRGDKRYIELFRHYIDETEGVNDSWHLDCAQREIGDWSQYRNESTTTVTTNYLGYTASLGTTWKCWRSHRFYHGNHIYGEHWCYTKTDNLSAETVYCTSDSQRTTDAGKLLKQLPYRWGTENYGYERWTAEDFTETNMSPIYVTQQTVGSKAYIKEDSEWTQIGTIDNVSGDNISFRNADYTRDNSLDESISSSETVVTDRFVEGTPTVNGNAYESVDKLETYTITAVGDNTITVDGLVYTFYSRDVKSITSVTGLARFNGQKVTALIDGSEYKDLEVENGEVELPVIAYNVLVGLPYEGILSPIPLDYKFNSGNSTVGLNRRIKNASIRYYRTRGLWYGTSLDKLYEIKPYTQYNLGENIPLETANMNLEVADTYKLESTFMVVQKSPLPALLQSITLEFEYGQKN